MNVIDRRAGIASVAALVIIAGFLVTSVSNYLVSVRSAKEAVLNSALPLTSDNVYSEIQRDLFQPVFVSSLMANDAFMREWLIEGEKDEPRVRRYLYEIKKKYNAVTAFLVSERTKTYYHAEGVLKVVREDEPRDAWYFRVRSMKDDYEINVDPDMANRDTMTIFINYKVFGFTGEYLGATGVGLTVGAVKALIERYQEKYGREVYFADRKGEVILHRDGYAGESNLNARAQLKDRLPWVVTGKPAAIEMEENGETVLVSARFIPELNWVLVVEQRADDLLVQFRRALYWNLAICAFVTLLVLMLHRKVVGVYHDKLTEMALQDGLTGVPNRRAFALAFAQLAKEVARQPEPVSLLMIDLDRFKELNDKYGHVSGDKALVRAAELIKGRVRTSDLFCRWGGEEFLVVLRGADEEAAISVAEEIRKAFEREEFGGQDDRAKLTTSVGVAAMNPGDTETALINRADEALYRAKTTGRNKVST